MYLKIICLLNFLLLKRLKERHEVVVGEHSVVDMVDRELLVEDLDRDL